MEKIIFEDLPSTKTPLNAENLNKIQDSIEKEINEINEKNEYSIQEQKIGKWIDGKPIYRKTFNYSNALTNDTDNEIGRIENIDVPVNIYGTAKFVDGEYFMLPRVANTNTSSLEWAIDIKIANNIVYVIKGGYGTTDKIYITVEYTKTTD